MKPNGSMAATALLALVVSAATLAHTSTAAAPVPPGATDLAITRSCPTSSRPAMVLTASAWLEAAADLADRAAQALRTTSQTLRIATPTPRPAIHFATMESRPLLGDITALAWAIEPPERVGPPSSTRVIEFLADYALCDPSADLNSDGTVDRADLELAAAGLAGT